MTISAKQLLIFTLIQVNCSQAAMKGFVVGGYETDISKYPHSAFLEARCKDSGQWICGSAILNQRLLLTAAHCVEGCDWKVTKQNKLITFVGHADLRKVSTKRKIIAVRVHAEFDSLTLENDIAVLMVRKNFPLGPNVKRVIITEQYPEKTTYGFVAGWGVVRPDLEVTSMILKHVRQKLRTVETCSLVGHLHEGMFCAGSTDKTSSNHPSKGDSGSAFVTNLGYHQIGLVSFCIKKYPALMVYTNVSYYFDWISLNARNIYCNNVK